MLSDIILIGLGVLIGAFLFNKSFRNRLARLFPRKPDDQKPDA